MAYSGSLFAGRATAYRAPDGIVFILPAHIAGGQSSSIRNRLLFFAATANTYAHLSVRPHPYLVHNLLAPPLLAPPAPLAPRCQVPRQVPHDACSPPAPPTTVLFAPSPTGRTPDPTTRTRPPVYDTDEHFFPNPAIFPSPLLSYNSTSTRGLLSEMGLPQETNDSSRFVDNSGAVELSRDRKSCHRSRHVVDRVVTSKCVRSALL